jgi:serine/threonine protein kinase
MATTSSSAKPGASLVGEQAETKFEDDYVLDKRLRAGSYGVVWTTQHKLTREEFAVKVIDRTKLKKKDDDATFREVSILKDLLEVDNIVKLIDFYVDPETFYMVQVYAKGGDVFDRLAQRTAYSEKDARDLGIMLLKTMRELHKRKICHRDMKPENLLLREKVDDTEILLADFGFAKYVPEEGLKTRCGTPAFVAPEILVGSRYDQQVDMWSVGCLLYMLIGGYPPFQDEAHRGLFRKIRAADFTFHDQYWSNVSLHAKQLISKLLTVDPAFRLDADEALKTTWLQVKEEHLSVRDLSGSISEIKKFSAKRRLKSAMHVVIWSVGTAFRQDKISDLLKLTDKKDEESKTNVSIEKLTIAEQQDQPFSMSKMHKKKFEDIFELGDKIHRGSTAIVKECRHKEWDQKYAVKIIKRDGKTTDEAVLHEVAVMNQLDHPHIVKVIDFFEESGTYERRLLFTVYYRVRTDPRRMLFLAPVVLCFGANLLSHYFPTFGLNTEKCRLLLHCNGINGRRRRFRSYHRYEYLHGKGRAGSRQTVAGGRRISA